MKSNDRFQEVTSTPNKPEGRVLRNIRPIETVITDNSYKKMQKEKLESRNKASLELTSLNREIAQKKAQIVQLQVESGDYANLPWDAVIDFEIAGRVPPFLDNEQSHSATEQAQIIQDLPNTPSELKTLLDKIQSNKASYKLDLTSAKEAKESLEKDIPELQNQHKKYNQIHQTLSPLEQERSSLVSENKKQQKKNADFNAKIAKVSKKLNELNNDIKDISSKLYSEHIPASLSAKFQYLEKYQETLKNTEIDVKIIDLKDRFKDIMKQYKKIGKIESSYNDETDSERVNSMSYLEILYTGAIRTITEYTGLTSVIDDNSKIVTINNQDEYDNYRSELKILKDDYRQKMPQVIERVLKLESDIKQKQQKRDLPEEKRDLSKEQEAIGIALQSLERADKGLSKSKTKNSIKEILDALREEMNNIYSKEIFNQLEISKSLNRIYKKGISSSTNIENAINALQNMIDNIEQSKSKIPEKDVITENYDQNRELIKEGDRLVQELFDYMDLGDKIIKYGIQTNDKARKDLGEELDSTLKDTIEKYRKTITDEKESLKTDKKNEGKQKSPEEQQRKIAEIDEAVEQQINSLIQAIKDFEGTDLIVSKADKNKPNLYTEISRQKAENVDKRLKLLNDEIQAKHDIINKCKKDIKLANDKIPQIGIKIRNLEIESLTKQKEILEERLKEMDADIKSSNFANYGMSSVKEYLEQQGKLEKKE